MEDARVRGGVVLALALVGAGLVLELCVPQSRFVGWGVILGGWLSLLLAFIRASARSRALR